MKLTFLGVSSALSEGFNSNILIEDDKTVMLFDCGEDIKHSLKASGRSAEELDSVYVSHLHSDHSYGLSWLGYYSYFILQKKLTLHIHESMISDLWAMLRPAMEKLDGHEMVTLDEYFNVMTFKDYDSVVVGSMFFEPVKQLHVETPHGNMYSYGAMFKHSTLEGKCWRPFNSGKERILISSDAKHLHIPIGVFPTTIFHDCDVMNLSGVHANYNDLKKIDKKIKKRIWLYHYTDLSKYDGKYGEMPDAVADGFAGFVKEGQIFEF